MGVCGGGGMNEVLFKTNNKTVVGLSLFLRYIVPCRAVVGS